MCTMTISLTFIAREWFEKTLGHLHQAHNKWKSSNEFCTVIDLTLNFLTKNMRCFWVASRDTNRKRNPHRLVTRTTMTTTGQQQIRNWKEACLSRLGKFKFQHFPISSFVSLFLEFELSLLHAEIACGMKPVLWLYCTWSKITRLGMCNE